MDWLKWYHGTVSDSKMKLVAKKSGQNVGTVVAIWAAILEYASQSNDRGSLKDFDPEEIDTLYGYEDGTTEAVIQAMTDKSIICHEMSQDVTGCHRLKNWEKRQVKDDGSTERKRLQREREAVEKAKKELDEKIAQYKAMTEQTATCHEMSQDVTKCHLDKIRIDKNRKDINLNLLPAESAKEKEFIPEEIKREDIPYPYPVEAEEDFELKAEKSPKTAKSPPPSKAKKGEDEFDYHVTFDEFVEYWNKHAPEHGLAQVSALTKKREKAFKERIREAPRQRNSIEFWRSVMHFVVQSDFLMGKCPPLPGKPPFELTVDWLIGVGLDSEGHARDGTELAKVVEGFYHRKGLEPDSPHYVRVDDG